MRRIPVPPAGNEALVASGAAVVLAAMLLGALAVAAVSGPVHQAAWGAAAGVAVLTLTGLLYAWRLGAYGRSR